MSQNKDSHAQLSQEQLMEKLTDDSTSPEELEEIMAFLAEKDSQAHQEIADMEARLKEQDINIPFTKKQKFLYALLKSRLQYLAQVNNPNKNITVLPRADKNDVNWTSPKSINSKAFQEYLLTKEKRGDTTK